MGPQADDRLTVREPTEREQEALRIVAERPGITVAELREALDVSPTTARKLVERLRGRIAVERNEVEEPRELEPMVSVTELSPSVVRARQESDRQDERVADLVATRISGHIATYTMALDTVAALHQQIADRTDIELSADTRWAAIWLLAGRSIGFARALVVLANAGIGDEGLPTARAMHECVRLLDAVSNRHDRQLVARWLLDDDARYVRPRDARAAVEAGEQLVAEMMIAAGEEPIPSTRELSEDLYHRMSLVTHNRRQAIELVLSPSLRRMARGRHPNPIGRAQAVLSLGAIVEEAVSETGRCLSAFLGPDTGVEWITGTLRPALASLEAVRSDQPLDEQAIRTAAEVRG